MTINGGKPHAVGDRGQRFEVTFFNPATFKRQVLGWCETREDAERIVATVRDHPVWEQFQIVDRSKTPNVGGEARLAAHQPSHTTTATPQGVASTDQLGRASEARN